MANTIPSSSSLEPTQMVSQSELEKDLEKLRRRLGKIQATLTDAEKREIQEESVKDWLWELKSVAYDAEDILDECEYDRLRYEVEVNAQASIGKGKQEVTDMIPSPPLHDASFRCYLMSSVKIIFERLDEIGEDRYRYALSLREEDGVLETMVQRETSALVDVSQVYGRVDDVNKMIDLLLSDKYNKDNFSLVSVVGMGGVGKTTLAQSVYTDHRIQEHFKELRWWVYVSEHFDVIQLTKAIVESVTRKRCDFERLAPLHESLCKELMGKRFLLIMDDIWNEDRIKWEALRAPLTTGARGSRVLITTRNEKVSSVMGAVSCYQLPYLLEDDCWTLFTRHAFADSNPDDHPILVAIGKEIIRKCKGLPLAVKILGSLLWGEIDKDKWEDILNSDIWDFDEGNLILQVLRLSYHHLPTPLKGCFRHCVIFPKGKVFGKDQLIQTWMAHGCIPPKMKKRMEDIGNEYVNALVQRSFFQQAFKNGQQELEMHDLIHDLAESIMGKECLKIEDGNSWVTSKNARHLLIAGKHIQASVLSQLQNPKPFRTFVLLPPPAYGLTNVLSDLFLRMRYLRVLVLTGAPIYKLPHSIGSLKHLRYLGLQMTDIRRLPETVCSLYMLHTLNLESCIELQELPRGTKDLINLRHLVFDDMLNNLSMMPSGIGKLINIQTLSKFVMGRGSSGAGIGELKDLNELRGRLVISGLQNVDNSKYDSKEGILNKKQHLEQLKLVWNARSASESVLSSKEEEKMLEKLQPPTNILDYRGNMFPCSWYSGIGKLKDFNELQGGLVLQNKEGISNKELLLKPMKLAIFETSASKSVSSSEEEEKMLERLQPHTNIKELEIVGYRGNMFPSWVGDHSFSKLVKVSLYMCTECGYLPPLGQLPSLKCLSLVGMKEVRRVGPEFWGERTAGVASPPSRLQKSDSSDLLEMIEWEEWLDRPERGRLFSCLERLLIEKCPRLKFLSLGKLTVLKSLSILDCPELEPCFLLGDSSYGPPDLPDLSGMQIWSKINWNAHRHPPPPAPAITPAPCIGAEQARSEVGPSPVCARLQGQAVRKVPRRAVRKKHSVSVMLPATLASLHINDCPLLEYWCIRNRYKLTYISDLQVSRTTLTLKNASKSSAMEEDLINVRSLVTLELRWDGLTASSEAKSTEATQVLEILQPCTNVKEIVIDGYRGNKFAKWVGEPSFFNLVKLTLSNCYFCESLPPLGRLPSLKELKIHGMHTVKRVGSEFSGGGEFVSLRTLEFCDMPEWVEWQGIKEGGFPRLQKLTLSMCPKPRGLVHLLPMLTSLCELKMQGFDGLTLIGCNCSEILRSPRSFASLSYLFIGPVRDLIILPLTNVFALKVLCINHWPMLARVNCSGASAPPGLHNLSSLIILSIKDCPNIKISAEEELPSTLQYVNVTGCPLLSQWFRQRDWRNSASIREVWVDEELIFTDDEHHPDGAASIGDIFDAIDQVEGIDTSFGTEKKSYQVGPTPYGQFLRAAAQVSCATYPRLRL